MRIIVEQPHGTLISRTVAITSSLAITFTFCPLTLAAAADCSASPTAGLNWSACAKHMIIIPGSELEGANLHKTDFAGTDLSNSNLKSANLEEANLMRASLADTNAEKANFKEVEAYRSNFSNIAADGASFKNAELQRTNFSGAKLAGANFERAELGRADFDKAVLTGSSFTLANLSRADLSHATFKGPLTLSHAFMFRTRIEGLDLSAAQGLVQEQIDLACGDTKTKLPAYLKAPTNWPCPPEDQD